MLAAAVVALHLLIVFGPMRFGVPGRRPLQPARVELRFIAAAPSAEPAGPAHAIRATTPTSARGTASSRSPAIRGTEPVVKVPQAAVASGVASAERLALPASAAGDDPLLDTEATRRAIRLSVRQGGLAARADDQVAVRSPTALQRLPGEVQRARKGDCVKGEYAGAGMGLLSVPFLAAAAATGNCAR